MKDWAKDPEYLALLQSVLDTPADDAPRLIISDWLEEHDQQQRAEFIRLQIELANLYRETPGESNQQALAERRLWLHRQALARFPTSDDGDSTANERQFAMTCDWDRGFIHSIKLSCDSYVYHTGELFLKYPITSVQITDLAPINEGDGWYTWHPCANISNFTGVPEMIYRHLECERMTLSKVFEFSVSYASIDEALIDLSNAFVAYGRQMVRLPRLPRR